MRTFKYRGPYKCTELLNKALRMANWIDDRAHTVFLTPPPTLESTRVHGCDRLLLSRALKALTKEEVDLLYSELIRAAKDCLEDGGDFTPEDVRAHMPHIYGEDSAKRFEAVEERRGG